MTAFQAIPTGLVDYPVSGRAALVRWVRASRCGAQLTDLGRELLVPVAALADWTAANTGRILAAAAICTTTVQLVTAVSTIGLDDPLRAFEDYSTLHHLAGGRLDLVIGNEGISDKVLTQTLRRLERDGLISRSVSDGAVLSVEYALTEHGHTVRPVLDTMIAWGNQHLAEQDAMMQDECTSS
jgi:DNA-binding HxlR family transcriptional regulator